MDEEIPDEFIKDKREQREKRTSSEQNLARKSLNLSRSESWRRTDSGSRWVHKELEN